MEALSLDQVIVFITVFEESSFTRAARRLHRGQSTVSYAIANLERLLDVKLFQRSSAGMQLTDAGRALLPQARALATSAAALLSRARSIGDGVEAEVSVAVDALFPPTPLAAALTKLRSEHPNVALILHTETLGSAPWLLREKACQLAISPHLASQQSDIHSVELMATPMAFVASPEHPLASQRGELGDEPGVERSAEQLSSHTQIVITDRSQLTRGQHFTVLVDDIWRVTDLLTKLDLLRAGLGWGAMPLHRIEQDIAAGQLVVLRVREELKPQTFVQRLGWRRDEPPGIAARCFIDALHAALHIDKPALELPTPAADLPPAPT